MDPTCIPLFCNFQLINVFYSLNSEIRSLLVLHFLFISVKKQFILLSVISQEVFLPHTLEYILYFYFSNSVYKKDDTGYMHTLYLATSGNITGYFSSGKWLPMHQILHAPHSLKICFSQLIHDLNVQQFVSIRSLDKLLFNLTSCICKMGIGLTRACLTTLLSWG